MAEPGAQTEISPKSKSRSLNLVWGVGSLGTISMINSVATLYLFFLVGIVKMDPAAAGLIIFLSKVFDIITDPLMGYISDRAKTKIGRRRPFMLAAAPLCGLSMVSLFVLPEFSSDTVQTGYILVLLLINAAVLTAFNVPYLAMPAEMTDDYHERNNIMSYRAAFLIGGSFVGSAVSGIILRQFGSGPDAYQIVGIFLGCFCFLMLMTSTIGTKKARFTNFVKPTISGANQLKLILVNKPFLVLGALKAVQFLQLSSGTAATLFFFATVLEKDPGALFPLGLSVMAGSLLSIRLWLPVIKRFGKKETLFVGLVLQAIMYLTWLLASPQEPLALFMLRGFCLGVASAGIVVCSQSMITDAIAYDRSLSGLNREGLFSSAFSFLEKTMYAAGPLIVGTTLSMFGFDQDIPKGQPQPDSAVFAILLGQVWIPVACCIGMAVLLIFYRLDEKRLAEASLHEFGEHPDGEPALAGVPNPN